VQKIRAWIEHGAVDDAAGARAFLAQQKAAAKAAATAVEADANAPPPMPEKLPAVPVRLPPRAVPLQTLARSPRAPLLALPGCGQVLLFDGAMQQLGVLPCARPRIGALQFSTDGAWLAAACGEAGRSGQAVVYDVRTGEVAATVGKERDVPLAVAAHRGRGLVALGGSSKRARLFTAAGVELFAGKHDDFVLGLQFAPDGALLAAADRSGAVILWETDGGRIAQTLRGSKGAVTAVAFDRTGAVVFAAAADGTVRAFGTADGKERWQHNAHQGEALALACGPGDRIATCGSDGRIAVFAADGKQLPVSAPTGDWLYAAAFGESADVVYAGGARGALQRFDVATKKLTASTPLLPAQ
jgi:WD40 repeat protein